MRLPIIIAFDEQDYLKQHRNFAVTRISQATVSKQPIPTWVKTFNLDYLHHLGTLQYYITHRGKPITLKLKINQYACQHLQERPLWIIKPSNNWMTKICF